MGISLEKTKSMTEKEFFFAMVKQTIGVIILFSSIGLIIFLISKVSWWVGVIFFVVFGLACLVSFLQYAFGSILGIFGSAFYFGSLIYAKVSGNHQFEKKTIKGVSISDQSYVFLSALVQFITGFIFIVINYILYKIFFTN